MAVTKKGEVTLVEESRSAVVGSGTIGAFGASLMLECLKVGTLAGSAS
jgi:hypothetical protein